MAVELLGKVTALWDVSPRLAVEATARFKPRPSAEASARVAAELLGKATALWEESPRVAVEATARFNARCSAEASARLAAELLGKLTALWEVSPRVAVEDAARFFSLARNAAGGELTAFEIMPRFGIEFQNEPLDLETVFGRSGPRLLDIGFGARGNEAAVSELHGQTKVICKPSGGIDETALNLNATDLKLKHRG